MCDPVRAVAEHAVARADRPAVSAGGAVWTYRDLDRRVRRVAAALRERGVGPGQLVGLHLTRSPSLLAAQLAVWRAGGAFVPLDPDYPRRRLDTMVAESGVQLVLTDSRDPQPGHVPLPSLLAGPDADALPPDDAQPWDPAYVLFTSGSTGSPKGVVVERRSVSAFLAWAVTTFDAEDLAGAFAGLSASFDVSLLETLPALIAGGHVILAGSPLDLRSLPERNLVTLLCSPPSALRTLVRRGLPAGLRVVVAAGERLPADLVAELFTETGVCRVVNGYGPTEATVLSHAHVVDRPGATGGGATVGAPPIGGPPTADPPIGRPLPGVWAAVLTPQGLPAAVGEAGELWLAGHGLARGYVRDPALTTDRFVVDGAVPGGRRYRTGDLATVDPDGLFHYRGRLDRQVKIRGRRVEPGEVEAVLAQHPDVAAAVVDLMTTPGGAPALVAHVVPASGRRPAEARLLTYLSQHLAPYLVPSRVLSMATVPLLSSGKLDRAALPVPDDWVGVAPAGGPRGPHPDGPSRAPGAPGDLSRSGPPGSLGRITRIVQDAMAAVLAVPDVAADADFLRSGGDSLGAADVVARVGEAVGAPVPLADLLDTATPAGLARRVRDQGARLPALTRHDGTTTFPLTGMQWNLWYSLGAYPGTTNTIAYRLRLTGMDVRGALPGVLDDLVRRHEVLRTVVTVHDGLPVQEVRPPAPVPVDEVDLRARAAAEPDAAQVACEEVLAQAAVHRFDVTTDVPLMRATVVLTGPEDAEVALVVDHLAFDGFSIGILLDEIAAALGPPAGRRAVGPAFQVGDVAINQAEVAPVLDREPMIRFWRAELAGAGSPNLPGRERDTGPVTGRRWVVARGGDLAEHVAGLERQCAATRFTVVAAALGLLLGEATGHTDPLLGSVVALRDRPGSRGVIGPLVDLVPVRVRLGGARSFRSVVNRVRAAARGALANKDLGIVGISDCAEPGRPPGLPLVPVVLSMQPAGIPVSVPAGAGRVDLVGELDPGGAICDVAVLVNDTVDGLEVQLMHDVERMSTADVRDLGRRLGEILAAAADDPDRDVGTVAATPARVR